eukprot:g6707.t1
MRSGANNGDSRLIDLPKRGALADIESFRLQQERCRDLVRSIVMRRIPQTKSAHDQRKGPGETGMLGKYATHTDTTTTTFSFRSVTIGHAPDRGSIDLGHYAHLTASRALLAVGQRADGVHPDQNATQNDPNSSTTCAETQKRGGAENRWWQITSRTDEPGAEMDAFRLYNNDAGLTSRLDNASVEVYSSKASSDANAPDWELPDVGNIRAASDGGTVIYLGNTRLPPTDAATDIY